MTTAVSPDARQLWRRGRGPLIAIAVLLLAGLFLALLGAGEDGTLHPRSATQHGSRAVAELLADRGVDTTLATTAAQAARATGPDTTLLVARPEALTDGQRRTLARATAGSGGRTVLVAPGQDALDALAPGVRATDPVEAQELDPACDAPAPRRAGSARLGGYGYVPAATGTATAFACYPIPDAAPFTLPTLLALNADAGGDTVLLGAPDILYNQNLDEDGNASLALQLLGSRPHLVWYLPSGEAPASGDEESLTGLIDPGWRWAALQLAIAAALAAIWRARRLGPVVPEPLPVAVRAAETTEGRARLYHQTNARGRAADALRAATRTRLAPLTGVPPAAAHSPEALPPAVATRTGDAPAAVHALLFGPPPPHDAALVRLADDLDALERRLTPPDPTKDTEDKDHAP
jgi:hypothetical protein